jgi:archaemetzincin
VLTIGITWIGSGGADVGEVAEMLEVVRSKVEGVIGVEASIVALAERPTDAWDPGRGQLSSTRVLRWLAAAAPAGDRKLLAITDRDLFIPVLTYVFGEAVAEGPVAVVSTARLGQDAVGRPASDRLCLARLVKELIHELGHTFGLLHCPDPTCAMSRSVTVLDIDSKQPMLCDSCLYALDELLLL